MKKVLVVDFDVEFLKSVSLMLREEGFEIITAVDGQAGLERFEADKPDLVILEAMLPRLHGFELCARITENQAHSAPVIVITGVYRDALYKTEALRTFGATAYFEKPVEMSRLMEAVRKALGSTAATPPAPEPKKAPGAVEKPPPVRPAAGAQVQAQAQPQVKPQPVPRPQPPPRTQAEPAVAPAVPPVAPRVAPTPPPSPQPAKKIDADQFEIDSLLRSALAELGLEPEETKPPVKPMAATPPSVQPPPRPVAPPPPPRPIQPPPRPAAAPLVPPAAKSVPPADKPTPPPPPRPIAPAPPTPPPPVQPAAKPIPPPQPKPVVPTTPRFQPRVEPPIKAVPPPQPKPVAPPQPKPEPPPPPPPPVQKPKPAIVAPPPPPPPAPAPQPIPIPVPTPPPQKTAPAPTIQPAPPPLRQPTPEKLPVFEKAAEPPVHAPAVTVLDLPEKRGHAPAFTEFIAEPKKKSSPVVFIALGAVVGIAALGYLLVLKPKGREGSSAVRQQQPPPVVTERPAVENAAGFESAPQVKAPVKSQAGAAKPKPTPPPAVQPEPEPATTALQSVIPAGEAKLEIQIPEQTAPQVAIKPATEQTEPGTQATATPPAAANIAPAPPAKAQTGQLISLEEVDTSPRIVTRIEPVYPPIAYRMGIQGTVWINALVSETGNVLQAIFLRGTTAGGLDKAAETAVLKWKYQPAQKDGVNVKVWLPVRLDFVKRS